MTDPSPSVLLSMALTLPTEPLDPAEVDDVLGEHQELLEALATPEGIWPADLASGRGVTVLNSPGTIDADFRGELHVLLVNLAEGNVEIEPDERIAQLVIAPVAMLEPVEVEPQSADTERGAGGFGSTGRS